MYFAAFLQVFFHAFIMRSVLLSIVLIILSSATVLYSSHKMYSFILIISEIVLGPLEEGTH